MCRSIPEFAYQRSPCTSVGLIDRPSLSSGWSRRGITLSKMTGSSVSNSELGPLASSSRLRASLKLFVKSPNWIPNPPAEASCHYKWSRESRTCFPETCCFDEALLSVRRIGEDPALHRSFLETRIKRNAYHPDSRMILRPWVPA